MNEIRKPGYFPRIKELRVKNNKTQKQIADILHCNREVYRRYEAGQRELPVWALIKLAEHYKTSTDYILGRSEK